MSAAPAASPPRQPVILLPPGERTLARNLALAAIAVFVLGVLTIILALLVLPRRDTIPNPAPRVVIALGAGLRDDSTLTSTTAARLDMAIGYAHAHGATIVTTRVYGNGRSSDRAQRARISAAGLADRWIPLPGQIGNTRDEALAMHMIVPDTQRIVVVTSPLHTRRACATFERVGYNVTCVASADRVWWRLPYFAAYETAAYMKYRMRGWL